MSTITVLANGQTLTVDIAREDGVRPTDILAVTTKSLTDNVATLTTSKAHNLATGLTVVVAGVDATLNGTYVVVDVPTATTFTYAKTHADITEASATGTVAVQGALDSDGARVEFPVEISDDTTWTITATLGTWLVTTELADGTPVSSDLVVASTTVPAVVSPVMSQAALSAYVSTTVAAL